MSLRRERDAPTRAIEILAYFLRNPQAADTIEGVARWRLLEETVHRRVEEINEAIGWLVSQGFLLEEAAQGSAPIFCLNKERAAESAQFLAETRHRKGVVKTETR